MSGTKKAMSLHDRHAAEARSLAFGCSMQSLFTLTIRHLTYIHSRRCVSKVGFCIANNQNRMCREFMSEESGPVKETMLSLARVGPTWRVYVMHSLLAEWLPVSIAPSDGDNLEVCVLDYDGPLSQRWSRMVGYVGHYHQPTLPPVLQGFAEHHSISEAPLGLMGTFSIPEVSRAKLS